MADDKTTSYATGIDPENSIKGPDLAAKLEEAKAQPSPDPVPLPAQPGHGSQMVKDDKPKHNLNPPPEIRKGPDVMAFNGKWGQTHQQATARNEQAQQAIKDKAMLLMKQNEAKAPSGKDHSHQHGKDDHEK